MSNSVYIIFDSGRVTIEAGDQVYVGSYDEYLADGGPALPNDVTGISYAKGDIEKVRGIITDSEGKTKSVNTVAESNKVKEFVSLVLASSHILSNRYLERLKAESKAQGAKNLEKQRAEAAANLIKEQQALTLEQAKEQALQALKKRVRLYTAYQNSDVYFISSLGYRFNSDQRSLASMKNLLDTFDTQPLVDGKLAYLDFDNVYRYLSKDNLKVLITETQLSLLKLFKDIQSFKASIKNASDKKDIYIDLISFNLKQFNFIPADYFAD